MKKAFALLALIIIAFVFGCKKKDNAAPQYHYSIDNIPADITMLQYKDSVISVPLRVIFDSGANEHLSISFTELPAGVTVDSPKISGNGNFTAPFVLHAHPISQGRFMITVLVTGSVSGTRKYEFYINVVTGTSTCVDMVVGSFSATDACSPTYGQSNYTATVSAVSLQFNKVNITLPLGTLRCDLHCDGTFEIETYLNGVFVLTGGGTCRYDKIVLNYSITGGTVYSCTTTLTR